MAARFIQLLYMSCHVCMILHVCSIQGVNGEVPDDAVYTDLNRYVRIGDRAVLKCQFRGSPLAVYWKKGIDPQTASNLVSWIKGDPVTGSCGEKPCQVMEMNEDHSLVIKEVSIADQGRYICRVANYKGNTIHNFTEITAFSPPKEPYPLINECLRSPDINSNQTCVLLTAEGPINISCTVSGYFPDLDLFFIHGSQYIPIIHYKETTNEDGKKNKSITIQASPSPESYVCVASDIPGFASQRAASLFVTVETASVYRAGSTLVVHIVAPLIVIIVLVAVILAYGLWYIRQQEPVSYLELWKLVDETDLATVNDIVSKLVGDSEKNLGKEDLYRRLCEWKEGSSGKVRSLYRVMVKLRLHDDLRRIKDFRACTSVRVADDVLAHIRSHVHSFEDETVNPILRALYPPSTEGSRPTLSTCNSFEDDQMMKRWKSISASERVSYCSGSEEISIQVKKDDEMTPMYLGSGEIHPKVITSPPNQMIRLCLALEEAGKTANEHHRSVYLYLAKTFFKSPDEYTSGLTDGDLEESAINVHTLQCNCNGLGNTLELPQNAIDAGNGDALGVTNARVHDKTLKNYEIRHRLRQTAEPCIRREDRDKAGSQKVFDEKLKAVAERVVKHEEMDDLGKDLGFEQEDIQRYAGTNMNMYRGTLLMLRDWRKKQSKATERGALKDVLEKAGQNNIADELFGREEDFDEKLKAVAQKVVNHGEIYDLGKALGCEPEDIQRCVNNNIKDPNVLYMGTLSMLRDWRKKQTKETECEALTDVLEKAGQIHLAYELFGREEDFDEKLKAVAQRVVKHGEIYDLGNELGFELKDIQRYVDTNMNTYMGTLLMLRDWRKRQPKATDSEALKDVLKKASQIFLTCELIEQIGGIWSDDSTVKPAGPFKVIRESAPPTTTAHAAAKLAQPTPNSHQN